MKYFSFMTVLFVFIITGCAYHSSSVSEPALSGLPHYPEQVLVASNSALPNPVISEKPAASEDKTAGDYEDIADVDASAGKEETGIADPLEPFNRAMYQFNDKFYFWVLKPVAQGYSKVLPEGARISVGNFFSNIAFPVRFVNCLLQAKFKGAAVEVGRFVFNTLWGIGGLLDPASSKEIGLKKQDTDFGQTLGVYGLGQGFYIHWPILGPSSPRDTIGTVGDAFLHPSAYLYPWYFWLGARACDKINDTSLKIGDYESLKEAAIDPYVAVRNAYAQYRRNKVERGGPVSSSGSASVKPAPLKE
ncbi:MAG: hypothetical protein CSYNP_01471 [Syntrophus sp. SKADARSKE-3]|nr:hypothetical protein [Syntrophus sp. SKADARSKE-3]